MSIGVMGLFFCQTEGGYFVEEEYGLDWLFKLRGDLPPPSDIVIISMDRASQEILDLDDDPEKWPRSYYAQLIEKINQQEPALLAFNIVFKDPREPSFDQMLANAMTAKKNVILGSYLKQKAALLGATSEQNIESIDLFNNAALGTAPFKIPKTTSSTVKAIYKRSAGDLPTFPTSIFQYFVIRQAYPEILKILSQIDPVLHASLPKKFADFTHKFRTIEIFQDIETSISKDERSLEYFQQLIENEQYDPKIKPLLTAWLELIKSNECKWSNPDDCLYVHPDDCLNLNFSDCLYLNHYGDVGTITTVPFYQALRAEMLSPNLFKNKIVLLGYADSLEPEKQQGLYTAFSKASGNVVSPIEIAGTAVANMIDQSWLKPLPHLNRSVLVLFWGILLSGIFILLAYKVAMIVSALLIAAYIGYSLFLFNTENIWLPLAIPLAQALLVMFWQSCAYFIRVRKVSERYLPKDVFARNTHNPEGMHQFGTLMQGVCLATDAGQYTSLSETITPLELHRLMNDYYTAIFPRVKGRQGMISDVIGDAMLAVWASPKIDARIRLNACHAALEIKTAITRFNEHSDYTLLTRMGLHYGEMRLGNVGAMEHYEYRAVGDTVNTATRIEGLNKLLGTRILVSEPTIESLQGFFTRELGTFLLKGKSFPVTVYELVGTIDEVSSTDANWPQFAQTFKEALTLFKAKELQLALEEFRAILKNYPDDGPTSFYIKYIQSQLLSARELHSKEYTAIINVGNITT